MAPRFVTNKAYWYCNAGAGVDKASASSIAYFAMSRGAANNYDLYRNLTKYNFVNNSTALINNELWICGRNGAGSSTYQLRFAILASYLTEVEVDTVINAIETCLDTLGTGLI